MCKNCLVWVVAGMLIFALTLTGYAQKVTIDYWHQSASGPRLAIWEGLIEEYNKDNPNVKVKGLHVVQTTAGSPSERLIIAIAGGTPPDVADLGPDRVVDWVIKGAVQPLTKFVQRDKFDLKKEFFEFAFEPIIYKGEVYELPLNADARALYYNKEVFREVGLDVAKLPKTIAELDKYAEKLTVKGPKGVYERMGFIPWYGNAYLLAYGWRFGGEIYDPEANKVRINEEPYIDALTWMVSYAKKYGATTLRSFSNAFGSGAMHPFIMGRVAMVQDGNWRMANYKKYAPDLDYDVTPFPKGPGGVVTTWASGWAICMPKGSKHPEEAWEFMKWAAGEYAQTKYCLEGGVIPSNKRVAADPRFREAYGGRQGLFLDLLPLAKVFPPPEFAMPNLLWDEMLAARDYALEGTKTPKQALDDVAKKVNAAIAPYPVR